MSRHFAIALAVVLLFAFSTKSLALHEGGYGWTVSKSAVDPLVNSGLPTGGVDTLFLWFFCSDEGMSAAEMTLESIPPGQVLAFNVMNGYLNAGNATNLLLAVGGCPSLAGGEWNSSASNHPLPRGMP